MHVHAHNKKLHGVSNLEIHTLYLSFAEISYPRITKCGSKPNVMLSYLRLESY